MFTIFISVTFVVLANDKFTNKDIDGWLSHFLPFGKIDILQYGNGEKNNEIIVQDNTCIHRKAPLSEGFIDKKTKNVSQPWDPPLTVTVIIIM